MSKKPRWNTAKAPSEPLHVLYLHSLYGDWSESLSMQSLDDVHGRKVDVRSITLPGRNGIMLPDPLGYLDYNVIAEYVFKSVDIYDNDLIIGCGWGGGVAVAVSTKCGIPIMLLEMGPDVTFRDLALARPQDFEIAQLTPDLEMLIKSYLASPDPNLEEIRDFWVRKK